MKKQHYSIESDFVTECRIKFAQLWHGKHRKTLVYSVEKGFISFPHKERVRILYFNALTSRTRQFSLKLVKKITFPLH